MTDRSLAKRHQFTLTQASTGSDGFDFQLTTTVVHAISTSSAASLAGATAVLPPADGPIGLELVLQSDESDLPREEAVGSPVIALFERMINQYRDALAIALVCPADMPNSAEDFPTIVSYKAYSKPSAACRADNIPGPVATLESVRIAFAFSATATRHRGTSPLKSLIQEPQDEELHLLMRQKVSTAFSSSPLSPPLARLVEEAVKRVLKRQMCRRWPFVFNLAYREAFERDCRCYDSIAKSLVSIVEGIGDDDDTGELRCRLSDSRKLLLDDGRKSLIPHDYEDDPADPQALKDSLTKAFRRLHISLFKPPKLPPAVISQATPAPVEAASRVNPKGDANDFSELLEDGEWLAGDDGGDDDAIGDLFEERRSDVSDEILRSPHGAQHPASTSTKTADDVDADDAWLLDDSETETDFEALFPCTPDESISLLVQTTDAKGASQLLSSNDSQRSDLAVWEGYTSDTSCSR